MLAFCPLCASDELTESHRLDDGTRYAVCLHASHGTDGYVWQPSEPGIKSLRADGLGYELGIWAKLLTCFTSGEDFVPYGTVEDRFIESYPAEGSTLLHRYGHRWRDPDHPATRYSMSVYLALRLRELEKEGLLDVEWGPAVGEWAYNGIISYWRPRRAEPAS